MTLDEAIAEFEKDFAVVREIGLLVYEPYERRDMDLTPAGNRYRDLATAGWFADEEEAAEAWIKEAWAYAEGRGKTLFWKAQPVWKPAEYVAIDQAGNMNDEHLRLCIRLHVGRVYSSFFISEAKQEG
jgi:hypothetical protein